MIPHNREAKIKEETGQYDLNSITKIEALLWRLVVDAREANATVCPSENLIMHMTSVRDVLTHIFRFSHYRMVDLRSAYRSVPITHQTKCRYAFWANTNRHGHKILSFKNLADGASARPNIKSSITN